MVDANTAPSSPTPAPPISVVVVEDDEGIRNIVADWIRQAPGFTCIGQFPDAESAIAELVAARPDIALVDINLPGRNGVECVRQLKPSLPATQFVMLTVYEDATHIFDALASGATGYLLKRTTREALIAALHEVHDGGSPMTSNIARKVVQSLHRGAPPIKAAQTLSQRENEVLSLLAQGYMYKEIAEALGVAVPTINSFVRRIYEKLHVHSRAQAVALVTARTP